MEPESKGNKNRHAKTKKIVKKAGVVVAVVAVFATGWLVGSGKIAFNTGEQLASVVANGQPADLSVDGLQEIYDKLRNNYDGDIDQTKLLDGLKKGAVAAAGDTYTEYLSAEETKNFNSELNGTFEGIGAELSKENSYIVIISPIKGTPADKAGLQPQDIITKINGEDATNITVYEAVQKIRGEKGSTVNLTLIRNNQQLEVSIVRETIDIPSVEWRIEDGIGIIEISRFSDDTTQLTEKAAREFVSADVKKVILDLRGNPGGLLDQAVGVANVWLPEGATILEEKRGGETIQTFTAPKDPLLNGIKTVVLINEGSASASEIVSGALKDNKAATLMGIKSYGKGSVQQVIDLEGGGALKVTIARWYTPAGKNIDKEGIEPDTKVERSIEDIKAKRDPQLDAAKNAVR